MYPYVFVIVFVFVFLIAYVFARVFYLHIALASDHIGSGPDHLRLPICVPCHHNLNRFDIIIVIYEVNVLLWKIIIIMI